ncbi:unnamed protein product [Ceratitis capitata]|uniref:(Mediterranean fruit fly) hypothetical protein n=1 Tax=Ceratitis capitata TaxID=7213 RepID=A0A811V3F0_CERCA|nr:unnamed protein product [Ceratitis capitata]
MLPYLHVLLLPFQLHCNATLMPTQTVASRRRLAFVFAAPNASKQIIFCCFFLFLLCFCYVSKAKKIVSRSHANLTAQRTQCKVHMHLRLVQCVDNSQLQASNATQIK